MIGWLAKTEAVSGRLLQGHVTSLEVTGVENVLHGEDATAWLPELWHYQIIQHFVNCLLWTDL
jgi:hypothetical protein